jgi:glycosyltransferase involved in cell wall biosynthesis
LRTFLSDHPQSEVILYYGAWQARRGYDEILRLVCEDDSLVFVGCGRPLNDPAYLSDVFRWDVESMRRTLAQQGRIFEVELPFVAESRFVDELFESSNFVLLPYQNFYGMSGSLVQACAYGKPVLVPDIGYMAARVRADGVGLTFRHGNGVDMRRKLTLMRESYADFQPRVRSFARGFSEDELVAHFASAFGLPAAVERQ